MLESVTDDIFMAPYGEPLLLTGRPTELTGRVDLHNPTDNNLVIREADLRDPNGVLPGKLFRQVLGPIVLRPTQRQSVTLTIALDPTTPPGEYRVELDLAGRSRPLVLQVAEVFALKIQPSSFVVANLLNEVQEKRLIVTNQGNVPVSIADIGEVDLFDDLLRDQLLRTAAELPAELAGIGRDEFVLALVRTLRDKANRVGSLFVHNRGDRVGIAPGGTAVVDLGIAVQTELPASGRYRGVAPLLTQNLEIIVVSSSDSSATKLRSAEYLAPEGPPVDLGETGTTTSRKSTRKRGGDS